MIPNFQFANHETEASFPSNYQLNLRTPLPDATPKNQPVHQKPLQPNTPIHYFPDGTPITDQIPQGFGSAYDYYQLDF